MTTSQNRSQEETTSLNEALFINALKYSFDEEVPCDLSFAETLGNYCATRPYGIELGHAVAIIKKYRFAYYAKLQVEKAHTTAWRANQWPRQIVVEFYFNTFISMCRACLDCVAHWLNDVFARPIKHPMKIDLNKDKFLELIEQRRPELFRELTPYKGWISELSEYRDVILHKGNIIPMTVGTGPPETAAPEHWCSVLADPSKTLADHRWIVKQQAAGESPFIPVNVLCNNYAGNLSAVVRTCVLRGYSELEGRQSIPC